MRNKVFAILSILVVLSMVLTACGAKATPAPVPTAAPKRALMMLLSAVQSSVGLRPVAEP